MLITCEPVDILRCWHWFRLVDVDIGSDWLILTLHWFRLREESRKGLAGGKLKKHGNRLKSTDALVSSAANSILPGAIGSSLKESENKDQFRHLSDVTDEPGNHLTMSFA